jgi:hypothetical protein
MTTILYIAEIILYTILAINIGYLLLFALASKFYRVVTIQYSQTQ